MYISKKTAGYQQAGGFVGAGDLLLRRDVAAPALFDARKPIMGLCCAGCALLARLRPLVRVAGGPAGRRELSAPHISLKTHVDSTSLAARVGAAAGNVSWLSVVTTPLSGWEF